MGAQAASAQSHEFTSDRANGRTVVTGADEPGTNRRWFFGESFLECEHARLEGTIDANTVYEITLRPDYFDIDEEGNPADCEAAGNPALVTMDHCAYVFGSDTDENGHATVDIECDESRIAIELTGLGTTLTSEAQEDLHGVHYTTIPNHAETGKSAVTVDTTIDDLDTSCEGAFCFLFETGVDIGTCEGRTVLTGYEGVDSDGRDDPTTPNYDDAEGDLVNFTVE